MKKIVSSQKYIFTIGSVMLGGILTLVYLAWWGPIESVRAATPIYVRPDGNDSLCNGQYNLPYSGNADCAFATITYGISQVDLGGFVYVAGGTYNESLVLNRAITVSMTSSLTLNGNIDLQQGALVAPQGTLTLTGNYARSPNGVFRSNQGTLVMNGASQQSIGGNAVTSFYHIVINNPQHVRLDFNESVFMTVTLQSGNLLLGSYSLEIAPQGKVVGSFSASNMIATHGNGMVCKVFRSDESVPPEGLTFDFPIGDRTGTPEYSPTKITLNSGTLLSYPRICVRVVNQRKTENFFPFHLLRYWVTNSKDINNISATTIFTYTQSDVVGTESLLHGIQYINHAWELGPFVNPANHSFTKTAASFSDFSAGGNNTTITITAFEATPLLNAIRLDWITTYEENVQGFNVYRSTTNTPNQKLNNTLIPSISGGGISPGGAYTFTDSTASPGVLYKYWVQVVTASTTEFFGPVEAIWYNYLFIPLIQR
ncbi:MAG: hypothetical protein IT316_04995 [Anaerolineales bacterium]|nr:hypothetical protein [Anaerolineales bacterium]